MAGLTDAGLDADAIVEIVLKALRNNSAGAIEARLGKRRRTAAKANCRPTRCLELSRRPRLFLRNDR